MKAESMSEFASQFCAATFGQRSCLAAFRTAFSGMSRSELEALFVQNLPILERILATIGRLHFMQQADCEEFGSWAKLRFVENDYAILAKFRGESTLKTYLSVVLSTLYREYRVSERGRWRPSAQARRGGDLAIRLETLVVRDGLSLAEAAEVLRSARLTTFSDRRLSALAVCFPRRAPLRPVSFTEFVPDAAGQALTDELVRREESARSLEAATDALTEAMNSLPEEDRLIIRLLCQDGLKVADVARGLALPQKPLYRRFERLRKLLKKQLERAGVSREFVQDLSMGSQ